MKQYSDKMRNFSKNEKKIQMKQKREFLRYVENEWLIMKNFYSLDYPYTYIKHFIEKENNRWKIKQLVLSGYLEQDGLYLLYDFDLTEKREGYLDEKKIIMTLWDYQLLIGYYGEEINTSNYDELKEQLMLKGYITQTDWDNIFLTHDFYKNKKEIVLLPGQRRKESQYVTS